MWPFTSSCLATVTVMALDKHCTEMKCVWDTREVEAEGCAVLLVLTREVAVVMAVVVVVVFVVAGVVTGIVVAAVVTGEMVGVWTV